MQIFVHKSNQQYGPYTLVQLGEFVSEGRFDLNDKACYDGQNWVSLSLVPGINLPSSKLVPPVPQEVPPSAQQNHSLKNYKYAGFWKRLLATLIDTTLLLLIIWPIMIGIYGEAYLESESAIMGAWDFLISYIFPAFLTVTFWVCKSATPGKMITKIKIIDAESGLKPSIGQCLGRYLGYYISILPLFLGIIWVALDKKKQGWHDKLAGTIVVKS